MEHFGQEAAKVGTELLQEGNVAKGAIAGICENGPNVLSELASRVTHNLDLPTHVK